MPKLPNGLTPTELVLIVQAGLAGEHSLLQIANFTGVSYLTAMRYRNFAVCLGKKLCQEGAELMARGLLELDAALELTCSAKRRQRAILAEAFAMLPAAEEPPAPASDKSADKKAKAKKGKPKNNNHNARYKTYLTEVAHLFRAIDHCVDGVDNASKQLGDALYAFAGIDEATLAQKLYGVHVDDLSLIDTKLGQFIAGMDEDTQKIANLLDKAARRCDCD